MRTAVAGFAEELADGQVAGVRAERHGLPEISLSRFCAAALDTHLPDQRAAHPELVVIVLDHGAPAVWRFHVVLPVPATQTLRRGLSGGGAVILAQPVRHTLLREPAKARPRGSGASGSVVSRESRSPTPARISSTRRCTRSASANA